VEPQKGEEHGKQKVHEMLHESTKGLPSLPLPVATAGPVVHGTFVGQSGGKGKGKGMFQNMFQNMFQKMFQNMFQKMFQKMLVLLNDSQTISNERQRADAVGVYHLPPLVRPQTTHFGDAAR
jgi:hypothetical protein